MWVLYALGAAVTAALVAVFGKIGLREIDPTTATIVRGVIMAAILVVGGFLFGKLTAAHFTGFSGKAWLYIFLAAAAGAASWIFYFVALRDGPAGAVAVIDKLSVVFVIFLAALFLGESLTLKSLAGVALTVAGTLLILFK